MPEEILTRKQRKEQKAANRASILEHYSNDHEKGKKLDINLEPVVSPRLAVALKSKSTFTPSNLEAGKDDTVEKGSTSFWKIYNRTTLQSDTEKVRTKSYRDGKKTQIETFTVDGKDDTGKLKFKRTGKKVVKGNSTREVAYNEDGSKTVTKTGFFGTTTKRITPKEDLDKDAAWFKKVRHALSGPKTEIMHRKVGSLYESRYEMVGKEKVLVAEKKGLTSQYTLVDGEHGPRLTKTKKLGGLVSETVKVTGAGDKKTEEVVAKRKGLYRFSSYDNDDGTKTKIERQKGLMKKTTKQELTTDDQSGEDRIKETVTISRFGGLFNSTTTNVRAVTSEEQKEIAKKKLPLLREEAMNATRAMSEGLTIYQTKPDDIVAQDKLLKLASAAAQASEKYRAVREMTGTKQHIGEAIRELGKQERTVEILNSTNEEAVTEALKKSAIASIKSETALRDANVKLGLIASQEGFVGIFRNRVGRLSENYSQAKQAVDAQSNTHKEEAEKFDKSARSYVEYMNAKNPGNKPLELNDVKKDFLEKQRATAEKETEKAKSLQSAEPPSAVKEEQKKLLEFAAGTNGSKPNVEAFAAQLANVMEHAVASRGLEQRSRGEHVRSA